jgi:hypothetical protein
MEWTRSETLGLAMENCVKCQGLGLRGVDADESGQPCNCVLRNIFRACYTRFRRCSEAERYMSKTTLESVQSSQNKPCWGRKDEEYVADFCLLSRRALNDQEYRLFKYHFLLGADWRLCCRKLKMDRGIFFHMLYRVEQKLGRVFRETEPYALYPLDEYFNGRTKTVATARYEVNTVVPIRPPVNKPKLENFPTRKTA